LYTILELPIIHDSKRHMVIKTLVGSGRGGGGDCGGGGSGDGIMHSVHKINTAICAKLVMIFAVVCDRMLFM
jgi:hypothetical protein